MYRNIPHGNFISSCSKAIILVFFNFGFGSVIVNNITDNPSKLIPHPQRKNLDLQLRTPAYGRMLITDILQLYPGKIYVLMARLSFENKISFRYSLEFVMSALVKTEFDCT